MTSFRATPISNDITKIVWSAPHKQFYDAKPDRKKKKVLPVIKIEGEIQSPDRAEGPAKSEELVSIPQLNGYRKVREKLAEDAKVIRYVRGGQSYEEYVRQQQELQKKGEDEGSSDNDMVLMSIKDLQLGLVHMADSDSEEDDNDSENDDTMSLLEQEQMESNVLRRMTRIRKSLALPSNMDFESFPRVLMDPIEEGDSMEDLEESFSPLMKIASGITEKKERIRRDHLQYLECLYTVIVSIHNMKGRDLKSKTPLSLGAVKALEKYYNPSHLAPVHTGDRESKLNYLAISRFHSKLHKVSTTTVDSGTDGGNNHVKLPDLSIPPAGRKVVVQELPSSTISNTFSSPKAPLSFGRRKSMRVPMEAVLNLIQKKKQIIIETWEELVNLQIGRKAPSAGMGMHANLILKAMQWKRIGNQNSTSPGGGSAASSSSPGPSQTPHVEEPTSSFGTEKKEMPPSKKLPIWQQVASEKYPKSSPTKKKKCTNTKDVGNLAYNNRKKLHKIRSTVQQELEASLQKMEREQVVSFKMKYQVFDNLSPLFEEHVINMRRGKTNMARNVDVHHAKLCLLVMSLPAYSILTICMQKAIKYVLETILLGDLGMFIEWLSHRKMPLVLNLDSDLEQERVEKNEENTETEKDVQ
ncbi:hypothetical protein KP79_PYT23672 [Mizuhopecten yessoensis]|uniref:Uncharacterized protein n=1 Tax=Mizuhopecten yessoensis TaxID=6573 RepID=A0A210PQT7_MIZYE|nr:hypothetical protein KP79_PYT23672 [Mizuhopecten yessoensis]